MKVIFRLALGIIAAIGGFLDIGDLVFNTQAGANFGSRMGWERANVFAPAGTEPVLDYTWTKPG